MKKLILVILCILWMGTIFYNSSNNGRTSNERSYNVLNDLRSKYQKVKIEEKQLVNSQKSESTKLNENTSNNSVSKQISRNTPKLPNTHKEEQLNLIIRKNAHAFEYLVLAILVTAVLFSFELRGKAAIIYIMFLCLFYAVTDEFHQMFVPGRTSLVSDILIDFSGSLIGIFVFYVVYYKVMKRKNYGST